MPRAFSLRIPVLLAAAAAAFAASPDARAWPYSFEFGGALANYTSPGALLLAQGKPASSSASAGYDVLMTLSVQLQERMHGPLFSLGLQLRYLNGTSGAGDAFTVMPVSPVFRVEIWRLVLGAAYTNAVFDSLTFHRTGAIDSMLTLEAQFLFPITPEIDFGLQASRESFTSAAYGSNASVIEYGAFFRLNFGMDEAAAESRRKFKGWRYPLGSPLR